MRTTKRKCAFLKSNTESGFTLIEVLISMAVLAIGLLGMAYLQTWGMKFGQEASNRSLATTIGYEIMDRIRASGITAATAGTYTTAPADPVADCATAITNGTGGPTADRDCFYARIADPNNGLSNGAGSITLAGTVLTITIGWTDRDLSTINPNEAQTQSGCSLPRLDAGDFTWKSAGASGCLQTQTWAIQLSSLAAP